MAASVAPKSFYAHLFETSGVLAKVHGELTFFGDDDTIVPVEPSMINFLTVLGECGVANTQALLDRMHGGAAGIATHRLMEVA
jgi:hypothetical protein